MTNVVLDWIYNEQGHYTLLILTIPFSPVSLYEHMQMQSIKRVRRLITASVSLMALSALFGAHSKISESSTMAAKGYMP